MKTSLKAVFGLAMACAFGASGAWAQEIAVADAIKKGAALPVLAAKADETQAVPDAQAATAPLPDAPDAASSYVFSTTTTGSLTDMSTGTTQLIGANADDTVSTVTNIGFTFIFQGVAYTQFSTSANGGIRLGSTAISGTAYHPLASASAPILTAWGADQSTSATGRVHYRLDGSAPNRVLVIEHLNMHTYWNTPRTADVTYQARLFEGTGVIEYVYGAATMSVAGAGYADSQDPQFGFSSNSTAGNVGSVTAAQSGTPAPTFNGAAAAPVNNLYVAGVIPALDSAANGARRTFTFTPPAATAPTALTFSAITPTGMTLNWIDSPDELSYEIFRSTDGTNFTSAGTAAQNATSFPATGLTPSTNYFWRVVAYSEGSASTPLAGSQASGAPGNIVSTAAGGNWSDPATWVGGTVPTAGDNATITNGATVTIDVAAVALNVNVGTGGSPSALLQWDSAAARTLTVGTHVTIAANGRFATQATGTVTTHSLSLAGNLVNNGELDFSTNADTAGAGISFTGTGNANFGGTGTTTDVRAVTVVKGAIANTLELNPSAFTVRGVDTNAFGFLTLTSGTFKVSGTFPLTNRIFASATYSIPATGGFWLNNPNVTVSGQAGGTTTSNNGLFRISTGVYNIGVTGADGMGGGTGASFIIEGGTINATRIDPQNAVSWNQSGGTVNIGVVANTRSNFGAFELFSTTSTFTMSGGTINLVQATIAATPIDMQVRSGTISVTGGVVNVGTAATATNFNFRLRANIPNVVIDNTTNPKTATATAQINLQGTTTISSGSTLVINGFTCLVIGPTFTNNGTLTGTAASTRFYFLGGQGATTYAGSGTVTAPLTAFEVDNVAGVTIDPAVNQIIATRFNNFAGGLTGSGKLTLGNGGTTTAVVQLGVAGVSQPVLGLDVAPTFNPGSGGVINIYAQELTARTTGVELPPSRTLTTLSVSNTNGVTIAGGDITVNGAGAGALTLTDAPVTTGANTLYFNSAAGTVTRTLGGRVIGNFKKAYAAAGSKTFEVGTANGYSPVVANATAGTFPADITVSAIQGVAPTIFPPADAITRHWEVTAPGISAADLSFTYLDPTDLGTVTEADLLVHRRDGAAFTSLGGTIDTTANTAAVTGVGGFGVFTLAEAGVTSVDQADLQITKTNGSTTVTAGESTTYTIVASNPAGPQAMTGATVADSLPSSLTCNWTCTGSGGGSCTASGSGSINDTINLPVGAAVTYMATCAIDILASGSLVNTATVAVPSGAFETDPSNNSATDTDTIVAPQADLSISKTDGVTSVAPGQGTVYTITASNAGPNSANGAIVADSFPAALTGCTWTCNGSGGGTCGSPNGSGSISESVNLPSGGSATFLASCTVSPSASGSLANTATIAAPAGVTDSNTANNSATDTNAVQQTADVELLILNDLEYVQNGENVTLTVVVQNSGPSAAPSVAIAGVVPPELGFFSWSCTGLSGGACGAPTGIGAFATTASLPSGGTAIYTVQAQVLNEDASGSVSFSATATVGGAVADPITGNNTDTWDADVVLFRNGFDCTLGRGDCGPPESPPDYLTGFEAPDYSVGDVSGQQAWFAQFTNWLVSTANPPTGAQHVRGLSDGLGSSFALSPTLPAGTETHSYASARITINNTGAGATWRFAPQDTTAALVITRLHFMPGTNAIQVLQGNPAAYVTIPSVTWPNGTPFDIKVITRRADGDMEVCLNGTSVFSGAAISTTVNARDTRNVAIGSLMEAGSTGSTMDFDDVTIDNTDTGGCDGPAASRNVLVGDVPGSPVADTAAAPAARQ